jgi:hypothetical protein
LLFSEEPLHTAKLGDQPIKTAEILLFNGQNQSLIPQLSAVLQRTKKGIVFVTAVFKLK